jgi:hypothetical protein
MMRVRPSVLLSIAILSCTPVLLTGCAPSEQAPEPAFGSSIERTPDEWRATEPLRDLSGLAWVAGDVFVTVHDAKRADYPRVTLVETPTAHGGIRVRHLDVDWPEAEGGIAFDLESVTRIPGTDLYLLAESGDNGRGPQRLFLVHLTLDGIDLLETVSWPVSVFNVEATAVVEVEGALYFLYAERSQGEPVTRLRWAPMQLDPLRFGDFEEVEVGVPSDEGMNRPIVDLAIAADGTIYAAASYDPDVDTGPYTSGIFRVGRLAVAAGAEASRATVQRDTNPQWMALTNGLKIEGLAIREGEGYARTLFYGTDDEYYGGILRPVWMP